MVLTLFERAQLLSNNSTFVKGLDFYRRMLVYWKGASRTLGANSNKDMGLGACGRVWPCVVEGLWPC